MRDISDNVMKLLDGVIAREGGFVDHGDDPGGATNWGITEAVARAEGWTGSMASLPRRFALDVYYRQYVVRPGFDLIIPMSTAIADELIDSGVNAGTARAAQWLQSALNISNRGGRDYADITVDGRAGPKTRTALRSFLAQRANGERIMVKMLDGYQSRHYINLAERRQQFESFVVGWFAHRVGNAL